MEMYYFKNHSKAFFDYWTKLSTTDIYIKIILSTANPLNN